MGAFSASDTSTGDVPVDEVPVDEVLLRVLDVEPSSASGPELCSVALDVEMLRRRLDAVSLAVLGELDTRGTTDMEFGMRTGAWLAHNASLPRGSCNARVKVAHKVRGRLSVVGEALSRRRIGFDHAKVLSAAANPRIIDAFADVVADLVDLAGSMGFNPWADHVKAVAELLDQDGGHRPGDDICDNTLRLFAGFGGVLGLEGQLAGDNALLVLEVLEGRADEIFQRLKRDAELTGGSDGDLPVPPRKTLLALALVELIRQGHAKPLGSTAAPKPEVSLIINAADPSEVTDSRGVPIGDTTAFTLLCDPVLRPVVMGVNGVVIHLGREQRLASRAQRKAMAHRDGGCVWPGCENPAAWCDAHHAVHWTKQGLTDIENMGSLCRYHHGVTHRKGWEMYATEDQWFWWRSPSGNTFWSQRHGLTRKGPTPGVAVPPDEPRSAETGVAEMSRRE